MCVCVCVCVCVCAFACVCVYVCVLACLFNVPLIALSAQCFLSVPATPENHWPAALRNQGGWRVGNRASGGGRKEINR